MEKTAYPPSFYESAVSTYLKKFESSFEEQTSIRNRNKKEFWQGNPQNNTNTAEHKQSKKLIVKNLL